MPQLLLFNKPYDVLCQFTSDSDEKTLADYINLPSFYPAGRLDKKSEGLLLLTNDGSLQHTLSHPKFNKKKYYWVQVEGEPKEKDLEPLREGIKTKDNYYLPATARIIAEPPLWEREKPIRIRQAIPTTWLEIILKEGKNHQIRKMTAAIGFPTLRLVRHRIAHWKLEDLKPGESRLISTENFRG